MARRQRAPSVVGHHLIQFPRDGTLQVTGGFVGVVVGLAGAVLLARFASSMLYSMSPTDPLIFGTVPLILVSVALLAASVPAWRALKVDPIVILRYE